MTVCDVMLKINKANELLEYYSGHANPTISDQNTIDLIIDYISLLYDMPVGKE